MQSHLPNLGEMMTSGKWIAAIMIIVSGSVLSGFGVYLFAQELFKSPEVPLAIKIAVPTMAGGIIILVIIVIVDRWRSSRKETFKEVDY